MPEGQYVTYGQGRPPDGRPGPTPGRGLAGRGATSPAGPARAVPDGDRGRRPGPPPRPPERPDRYRGSGPARVARNSRRTSGPGRNRSPRRGLRPEPPSPACRPARPGRRAAAAARPYGRILIFTLLEDRVAEFDRLAEETAEQVRTGEPDTLVYVIHLVPNAPMQRIFYEIYRDRAAFDSHESQPYMQRFVAERRACVLATNVIELRLKYAKVAPLPSPPPAAAALLPAVAGRTAGPQGPPGPAAGRGDVPPARPQRSDQPRYGRCPRSPAATTSRGTTSRGTTSPGTTSPGMTSRVRPAAR